MNYVTILLLVTHRCILTYDQLQQELDVTNAPTINVPISPNVTFVTGKITLNTWDMEKLPNVPVKSVFYQLLRVKSPNYRRAGVVTK